jgi:hypothetical protein
MSDIFDVGTWVPLSALHSEFANSRRCWFPTKPAEATASGECWLSGTVTQKTIDPKGEKVTLIFQDERGEVSVGKTPC